MNNFNINKCKEIASKIIKNFEGCKLTAYQCSAKKWTIGYGNLSYLKQFADPSKEKITQEKAEQLFQQDFNVYVTQVLELTKSLSLNENQLAALISFAFNLGINALKNSTLLKVIRKNSNDFVEIEKQFMRWVNADGKIINGLVRRRQAEANLYSTK